jgi:hypothetical protein
VRRVPKEHGNDEEVEYFTRIGDSHTAQVEYFTRIRDGDPAQAGGLELHPRRQKASGRLPPSLTFIVIRRPDAAQG